MFTNTLSYILSSKEPNISLAWVPFGNKWYLTLIAIREILVGEQLSFSTEGMQSNETLFQFPNHLLIKGRMPFDTKVIDTMTYEKIFNMYAVKKLYTNLLA